jgi:hypothetical protein
VSIVIDVKYLVVHFHTFAIDVEVKIVQKLFVLHFHITFMIHVKMNEKCYAQVWLKSGSCAF